MRNGVFKVHNDACLHVLCFELIYSHLFCRDYRKYVWQPSFEICNWENWRTAKKSCVYKRTVSLRERKTTMSQKSMQWQNFKSWWKNPNNNCIDQLETRNKELETVMKAEEYVPVETKGYRLISKTKNISANSTKNYHTRKVFNWLILFNFKTPVFE